MFADSIENRINKIKLNFDNYLNDKRKDTSSQPPVPSIRRPDQLPSGYPSHSQNQSSNVSLSNGPQSMMQKQVEP